MSYQKPSYSFVLDERFMMLTEGCCRSQVEKRKEVFPGADGLATRQTEVWRYESGWWDSNPRPPRPERGALPS
jgi:hypothetical protein